MKTYKIPPLLLREQDEYLFTGLTDSDVGILIKALMAYRWHGITPKLSGKLSGLFLALKSQADFDNNAYQEKCETNRKSAKDYHDRQRAAAEKENVRSQQTQPNVTNTN